jgi:hypothetical protein
MIVFAAPKGELFKGKSVDHPRQQLLMKIEQHIVAGEEDLAWVAIREFMYGRPLWQLVTKSIILDTVAGKPEV